MGREERAADVETIRTKVGTVAAEAVSALRLDVDELRRTHKAFAYELEGFRREVAIAKAAPAELRRDVQSFRGDLVMKAEQIEALGLRYAEFEKWWPRFADAGEVQIVAEHLSRFQRMTCWQRLRWVFLGYRPPAVVIPKREMYTRVSFTAEDLAAGRKDRPIDG